MPYYQWNSQHAFPAKKLYLNLIKPSDELEIEYDFRFLTAEEAQPTEGYFWFECGKILDITDMSKVSMFLMKMESFLQVLIFHFVGWERRKNLELKTISLVFQHVINSSPN